MTQAMSWKEWFAHDGLGLADRIRNRDLTAEEVAAQAAAGIAATNAEICGVIEVFDDAVADSTVNGANAEGPFAGLPFALKDLGPTLAGRLQEQGSFYMKGNRPTSDAFLTTKMKQAGLNIIARTTTPEFGCCSSAENPAMYVTRNPWDTGFTSCGSSAGSSVMVGAGVLPIAHGTDGGGSIRIPAGCCGAIGLKSSRGTFSIAPGNSDFTSVVSTQGCISRSVRDTAAFVDSCRGGAPGEFMPYWAPGQSFLKQIESDPKPLKIAVSHEWGPYRATPHIAAELARVAKIFEDLGHHVEWALPKVDFEKAYAAQTTCYITNFAQTVNNLLRLKGLETPPEDLIEPMNIRIWEQGKDATYTERADMQLAFNETARAFGAAFEEWDILLTPTTALQTPEIGTTQYLTLTDNPSALDWFGNLWGFFAYTPLNNLCGTPGLSLPLAQHENGLPLGMQIHTRQGGDGLLLQLAAQVERAIGGKWNQGRLPQVHVTHLD
ncbi:amidase [Pseudooceanicola sp. CBS1P-1]|uniref:Amidase n=1 Tax=Pseudooceanicola albus TaxID=2692189 RepID=A0A6L7G1I4_9RHOB|nr:MULTISPECIES: amidase [Pseudooceanicola]MBT9383512.1 amidase [Pseudooceanicola endophyticus]MXN17368.1 amidase [Pseudooceanicola albus]